MAEIHRKYKEPGGYTNIPMLGTTLFTSAYTVYKGELLVMDATQDLGFARPFSTLTVAAGDVFLGVSQEEQYVGLTTNGAVRCGAVQKGRVSFPVASLTQADIGKTIYASSSSALTVTSTNNLPVGVLVEIEGSIAWIDITGFCPKVV